MLVEEHWGQTHTAQTNPTLLEDEHSFFFFFLFLPPIGLTVVMVTGILSLISNHGRNLENESGGQGWCYRGQDAEKGRSLDQVDVMKSTNKFSDLRASSLCNKLKLPLEVLAHILSSHYHNFTMCIFYNEKALLQYYSQMTKAKECQMTRHLVNDLGLPIPIGACTPHRG